MGEKWVETPEGVLELVNEETGEILLREKRNPIKGSRWDQVTPSKRLRKAEIEVVDHHWIRDSSGKMIWVPKTVASNALTAKYPKSQDTFDFICALVAQGESLSSISKREGYPPVHILYKWTRIPEWREQWQEARRARAEWAQDRIIEIASKEGIDKDDAAGERVRMDAAKFVAEVGDREVFGKHTKVSSESSVTIVLETGVPQSDELPVIEVQSTSVDSE